MIEEFGGMLTEGIWLRLVIEDVVARMQSEWKELTAQNVATEVIDGGNQGTITSDELLEMCEEYLQRFSDPFADLGGVPLELKALIEFDKNALFTAVTAKNELYKAHAIKLDAFLEQWQQGIDAEL